MRLNASERQQPVDDAEKMACRAMDEVGERIIGNRPEWFERMAMWFRLQDALPEGAQWCDRTHILQTGEWPPWAVDHMGWAPIAGQHPEGCDA